MSTENQNLSQIGEALVQKFVKEEIMTKSEFNQQLDRVMSKYTEHLDQKINLLQADIDKRFDQVDRRFEQVDKRFAQIDIRYNWIIGLIITATIGLAGILIKFH